MLRVLHYDKDQKGARQSKNSSMLSEAIPQNIKVKIINVCHLKSFSGIVGLEDLLLEEPFPFDAAIINGCSSDAGYVLDSVKAGMELNSLSPGSIIYLCPEIPLSDNCVHNIQVGSNGYFLNAKNAKQVVDKITELAKPSSAKGSGPGFVMY